MTSARSCATSGVDVVGYFRLEFQAQPLPPPLFAARRWWTARRRGTGSWGASTCSRSGCSTRLNWRVLVDARLYAPGVAPPPHLSPFANPEDEAGDDAYVPEYAKALRKLQARALRAACRLP